MREPGRIKSSTCSVLPPRRGWQCLRDACAEAMPWLRIKLYTLPRIGQIVSGSTIRRRHLVAGNASLIRLLTEDGPAPFLFCPRSVGKHHDPSGFGSTSPSPRFDAFRLHTRTQERTWVIQTRRLAGIDLDAEGNVHGGVRGSLGSGV